MAFTLVVPKRVKKELDKFDIKIQAKIRSAFLILEKNPYQGKKLEGEYAEFWSYKAWPYRIIYMIRKRELVVLILSVGHRQGIYR